jgi:hypothetical protein
MSNARDKANIPALNFSSTGIDDNATSTAITITSGSDVQIGSTNSGVGGLIDLSIGNTSSAGGITLWSTTTASHSIGFADGYTGTDRYRGYLEYAHNGDSMRFGTSATERMRINSSGNVGIGTSSPSSKLEVNGTITIGTGTGTYQAGVLGFTDTNFGFGYRPPRAGAIAAHSFQTFNGTRILEINESGNVGIGTTSPDGTFHVEGFSNPLVRINQTSSLDITGIIMQHGRGLSGYSGKMVEFRRRDGTEVGSIRIGVSTTSYNTSSDYRLKENVSYDFDATTRLKQLKPARFNFIADANTTVDGFLAHEVQSVIPEAISGEKDAVDDDGNPKYQGIDQSKLVPLLVKTIQELEARITQLENA